MVDGFSSMIEFRLFFEGFVDKTTTIDDYADDLVYVVIVVGEDCNNYDDACPNYWGCDGTSKPKKFIVNSFYM